MRRAQRLRATEDFQRVRAKGRSWSHPLLVIFVHAAPDGTECARVGISAGRRVGGAVVRNRAKRRVREAVREQLKCIEPGWDIVFVVRPPAARADYEHIRGAVATLLGCSGLYREEQACAGPPCG